jgi:antitoxin CptB
LNASVQPTAPGKLIWRCRRGMKELDLLLMRYVNGPWHAASLTERRVFEQFLELPDPLIAAYLVRGEDPEDCRFDALVATLRSGSHP